GGTATGGAVVTALTELLVGTVQDLLTAGDALGVGAGAADAGRGSGRGVRCGRVGRGRCRRGRRIGCGLVGRLFRGAHGPNVPSRKAPTTPKPPPGWFAVRLTPAHPWDVDRP